MTFRISFSQAFCVAVALAALTFVGTGCKSTPKVDWNSRVGNYTHDQAIVELGPPDRSSKLSDGRTVAEWIQRNKGGGMSFGIGTGFSTGHTGVGVGQSIGTGHRDKVLRLTFSNDGTLMGWFKN